MSVAKRWCFTINNPTDADKFWLVDGDESHPNDVMTNIDYLILQEERGEEGTLHWQGFLILKKKNRMTWLKRRLNARAHWEVARGNNEQARDYCRKDDTYTGGLRVEIGALPERAPVKKRDERLQDAADELEQIKEVYKRPRDVDSITLLQPGFIQAYRMLTTDMVGPYRPNLKIVTLVGPPGVGKSMSIQKYFPDHGIANYCNSGLWFGNPLADVMVFEEFCGQIQLQRMLRFLDPYPLAIEIKLDMRPAMYTLVIITSNTRPDGWYKGDEAGQPGKRTDALLALWDRLGYNGQGSYVPVRECGIYLEMPTGMTVAEAREWFDTRMKRIAEEHERERDEH